MKGMISMVVSCVLGMSTMSAQAAGKPDLIPSLKGLNSGIVKVINKGKAESRTSWLTIMCVADCPEHPSMATYKNAKFPNAVVVKVPALNPGQVFKHQLSFWKHLEFKPGVYKFLAIADAGKDIPESDELNNKTSFIKKVKKLSASNKFKSSVKSVSKSQVPNTLASNVGAKPDLQIRPYYTNVNNLPEGYPTHSFCVKPSQGGTPKEIRFWVENKGGATAGESQMNVLINAKAAINAPNSVITKNIASLDKGQSKLMSITLPANCYTSQFNGSCFFSIRLDTHFEVDETNENNNRKDSYCVSPAG